MVKHALPEGRVAYSLSGGGSHGAYMVGQLDWLHNVGRVRDVRCIIGTSTGALIAAKYGAAIATGDPVHLQELKDVYTGVVTDHIVTPHSPLVSKLAELALGEEQRLYADLVVALLAGKSSVWKTEELQQRIADFLPRAVWKRIVQVGQRVDPLEIGFCVSDLQSGESLAVTNLTHPDPDVLAAACLASSNQPVLMPPIEVADHRYCVDGGLRDVNPVRYVFEATPVVEDPGVEAILALNLSSSRPTPRATEYEDVGAVFGRTLELLVQNTYEGDIVGAQLWNAILTAREHMSAQQWSAFKRDLPADLRAKVNKATRAKQRIELISLGPRRRLTSNSMVFDRQVMQRQMEQGFRETEQAFDLA